ncbi:hypothetical protein AIIKEEIJ_04477 [Rhodococcus sp. YH1]|nr:hypothetical protein [Rhodococcus sp. YH1]
MDKLRSNGTGDTSRNGVRAIDSTNSAGVNTW